MEKALKAHIEYLLCLNIERISPISGGDISQAYLLETDSERFFCKINYAKQAHSMFSVEKKGLRAIAKTKTIAVPKVVLNEPMEEGGLLIMEYIESKRASPEDMARFGHHLAALHQQNAGEDFGWEADNCIGSLPQSNNKHTDWSEFYVTQRLLPQLKLARDANRIRGHEIASEEKLLKTCRALFPEVKPSLLHGDLWSGNYLISQNGTPYLIDPAPYNGQYEVDMAMTRLFGGFGTQFYGAHAEHFPKIGGETERNDIYQLYYFLVHLNLFGSSYYQNVKGILHQYF